MSGVPERKSRKYQSRQWARVLFLAEPMFEVARKILSVASIIAMAVIYAFLAGSVIFIMFYFGSIMFVIFMMAIFESLMTASFLVFVILFFYGPGVFMSRFYNNYFNIRENWKQKSCFVEGLSIIVSAYYIFIMYVLFFDNKIGKDFLRWLD